MTENLTTIGHRICSSAMSKAHTALSAIKGPEITNVKQSKRKILRPNFKYKIMNENKFATATNENHRITGF